jgi:tetratricopeptide (TPR) repeat protein
MSLGPCATIGVGLAALLCAGAAVAAEPPATPAGTAAARASSGLQVAADKDRLGKQAMSLHDEAWTLYEQGRYHAAIEKLEAALRLDPDGKELVYNLAILHEKLADTDAAERYYRRYLEMEPDPKAKARIQGILRRIEGLQRELADPSRRRVAGPAPLRPEQPSAPPPPRPVKPWVVATGTVAGVAFLMGSIFGLAALARNPGANAHTSRDVSISELQADARAAHVDAVISDVSFLITLAATGTATFLYFSTPRGAPQTVGSVALAAPPRISVGPGLVKVGF